MTTPTIAQVIASYVEDGLDGVNTCLPGRVEFYNAVTGRATVQPLVKRGYRDEEGERQSERRPAITEVPVVFPGSGGVRIKWPVSRGDTVLLVFASGSLERWLEFGTELDPGDDRKFHLTDAIAIPGLLNRTSDASPQIEFTLTGEIHAGGSEALALKSDVDELRSKFNAHTHASNGAQIIEAQKADAMVGTSTLKGS